VIERKRGSDPGGECEPRHWRHRWQHASTFRPAAWLCGLGMVAIYL